MPWSKAMNTCELDEYEFDRPHGVRPTPNERSFLAAAVTRQLAPLGLALVLTALWAGVAVLFAQ
jgi:hypothetical protein